MSGTAESAARAARADAPPARPSLSVIMITRDEEAALPRALESVRWADEIVIVDSGSTDRTEEIARRYTDRFVFRAWEGYGRQKQHALELATGEWVFVLDADEEVTPGLRRAIEQAIAAPGGFAGFTVELHTAFLGAWFGSRGWRREYKKRLFRRDRARFRDAVIHETVDIDGPVGRLRGVLLHHHYRDLEHEVAKLNRYTSTMAAERLRRGARAGPVGALLRGTGYFLKSYLVRGGFLYGRAGLVEAVLNGMNGFLKHAKLWELGRRAEHGPRDAAPGGRPRP